MKCVYCLEFTDGKRYIGSTKDLKRRLSEHSDKGSNAEAQPELKAAIENGYKVVLLEILPDSATNFHLKEREQYYLNLSWETASLYNKSKYANCPDNAGRISRCRGRRLNAAWEHTEEIKALRATGMPYYKIGKQYNCHPDLVKAICIS